ncbi:MAG: hypothetical protein AB8G77_22665 [Rhodothermales bacterium]
MSQERRYNEQEIAEIFKQAAVEDDAEKRSEAPGEGLTLAEIANIGKDVGISSEAIARAAAGINKSVPQPSPTTSFGKPVSVAHVVDLPGTFTDKDWENLVVDLHDTFGVPGVTRKDGGIRQWVHENLHVMIEPTAGGARLRIRNLNDALRGGLIGSSVIFVMGLFFLLILAAKNGLTADWAKLIFMSIFSVVGTAGFLGASYKLAGWRKEQEKNMSDIAARALERAGPQVTPEFEQAPVSSRLDLDLSEDTPDVEQVKRQSKTRS